MPSKDLGKAEYMAIRNGNLVKIIATGVVPGMNVKVDIEQLPFLIQPPMFALYFIRPDIVLPAVRPFIYEEEVVFPKTAARLSINDADGRHIVEIENGAPPADPPVLPAPGDKGYCVFSWTGIDQLKIAKCDAALPAVYSRIFGPDTFAECQRHALERQLGEGVDALSRYLKRLDELMQEASGDARMQLDRQFQAITNRKIELLDVKLDSILNSQKVYDAQATIEHTVAHINKVAGEMATVAAALQRAAGVLKLVGGLVGVLAV